jgi:hypothetical protein
VGVTGGGPKFLRTLSGRRSHAYDLAANNTSASSSQPSPATASRGRESVGSSSVDREAPSVVVPFVAAEDEVATTPAGRVYSWHYLNETGPLRNIPGSVVDETIDQATDTTQLGDRTIYYDAKNDITVVQSDTTGKIMSVRRGAP